MDIAETARAAAFFRSDAVVVTGVATGTAADPAELEAVRAAVSIPVVVGSGVTLDNVETFLARADALIVGSHLKRDGRWENPPDPERVSALMERVGRLR